MFELIRRSAAILFAGVVGLAGVANAQPAPSGDPPARVGRLAYLQGTVSFHDRDQSDWAPATINRPLTSGDAVWTEPNARSELSIAGARVRMDSSTQLDMLALDDSRTRMQLDQGRLDIKAITYDAHQPYEVVTPRGTITLEQQGDYYVEAGTTDDPTRLGVRAGAAQFQAADGRVLAVRANEVAEITGDGSSMELHTIQAPPPPMPQYWAERDRIVAYDQPPQYLSAGVTGYEDLNYYGTWQNDPQYGQVWYVRDAPSGWAPYSTGRWVSDPVYGWTWVDEQPWGFAPYHYGRWAQRDDRWFWVPPEHSQQAVYAPALVAFVGGTELGLALGAQQRAPVGWFPLGPREVYVPPYATDRDYYRRLNLSARVEDRVLEDRWQRTQRHEAIADQNWMNRRFATVVPAQDFARSQPVERVALRVAPEKMATVPVAAVAVPPSPTVSVRAVQAPTTATAPPPSASQPPARPGEPPRPTVQGQAGANASVQAKPATLQAIKPEPQAQKAPGPQIAAHTGVTTGVTAGPTTGATAGTTANTGAKPALPKLEPRNASAPPLPPIQGERKPATTQPGPQQATSPANQPSAPAKPGEPPKPGQPQTTQPQHQASPQAQQPPKPGEPTHAQPPAQAAPPPLPPRQGQAEPPKPATAPQPQHQATPATPAQPATPPHPQQAQQPAPPPHQATPATPAQPAQPQHQAAPVAPPQPQHQAPPQQSQAPAPPPVEHQAAPAPPPVQHQAAPTPPPVQHQAAPPPQQSQAPHPAPPPPQAAHPVPPPPQQHQQAQQPAPQKQEEKKQQ
jgi:hypothetical protein